MEDILNKNILLISLLILLMAFLFAFVRLIQGPTINDRIAALDLIASIVSGFILVYAVLVRDSIYLDVVIVIALVSFVGTIAISTYLKQKSINND